MSDHNDAIRKAAILVSALDVESADALLEGLPEETAATIRARLMEMGDVDLAEEESVVSEFLRDEGQAERRSAADEPEYLAEVPTCWADLLSAPAPAGRDTPAHAPISDGAPQRVTESGAAETAEPGAPFEFLQYAPEDKLLQALRSEHPQTVAVVLSHVSAAQAAAVMTKLPPHIQGEVAGRMAGLGSVDNATLQEIEDGLRELMELPALPGHSQTGLKSLQKILAASGGAGGELFKNVERVDAGLAHQLTASDAAKTNPPQTNEADGHAPIGSAATTAFETPAANGRPARQHSARPGAVDFEDLARMGDADLGRVLQNAPGRILLLALAGAGENMMHKVYAQLPRSDAAALRRQIEQQGPIRLRDVEEAQRHIGRIAAEMAAEGDVTLPPARRLTAAA